MEVLKKGRISVWLIIVTCTILVFAGKVSGDQYVEIVKVIGGLWLGAEATARGAGV